MRHIPVLRFGKAYASMDRALVRDHRDGRVLAEVSQANAGLIRRDARGVASAFSTLRAISCERWFEICRRAAHAFRHDALPLGEDRQTPEDYVECLSAASGLPHRLCRANMEKIATVLDSMPLILRGLTRGLKGSALDQGMGEQHGVPVSFYPQARSLGVILPSNSPGVNSIWLPAIPLKIPVIIKPGRDEPWTPFRIIQAFLAAGAPPAAFCFYPADHEGSGAILSAFDRAILFGDERTTAEYAGNPSIQVHGPGWSKILVGRDQADRWSDYLDLMVESVVKNGGRSCINASSIWMAAHGRETAQALAERLARIEPAPMESETAELAAFVNPQIAEAIHAAIEAGLETPGAEDLTARFRKSPRLVQCEGSTFLLPTVVYCEAADHPLAEREFLFPYISVIEMPQAEMVRRLGPTLVATAITNDPAWRNELLDCPAIQRLNLGPIPTTRVRWDQPHEGNLFEFLYKRRAIQTLEFT